MKLYDTLSGEKQTLKVPRNKPLRLFVCGPTVYDNAHLGHARTYIAFDALVRFLRSEKIKVIYLQNITDVDDKIIERARREKTTPENLARANEASYKREMKRIGVTSVTKYARASAYIPEIVKQITTLEHRGHAYEIVGSGWYFDIATFPRYGQLSKRTVAQAEDAQTRIDENIAKRNRGDFTLWKFVTIPNKDAKKKFALVNGEPAWNTKLGWGRPGWHIEDTAITETEFGPQYDLHGGGEDLKFPHHEAEIAQEEAASGTSPLVKFWLHTGFVRVNGAKMSKSLGNFVTIDDFLKTHTPEELRWLILSHHYRSPIDFNESVACEAAKSLDTLRGFIEKLRFVAQHTSKNASELPTKIYAESANQEFFEALEDDFNTPVAIAALFGYMNEINPTLWAMGKEELTMAATQLTNALKLFGIAIKTAKIPSNITKLVRERELSRTHKQFARSDNLRNAITELGYSIDDTPLGPFVRRI